MLVFSVLEPIERRFDGRLKLTFVVEPVLDVVRRLTCHDMDAADRFSVLLTGTDDLLRVIRHHELESLRSRISYAHRLLPFSLADTVRYVHFHLERVHGDKGLFSDDAVKKLFHASRGHARHINQLAGQALIQCAIAGKDRIDGAFMARVINAHPLYHAPEELP